MRVARKCSLQVGASGFPATAAADGDADLRLEGKAAETHKLFMQMVFDLIDGTHDASAYEDACRSLLGQCLAARLT